MKIPEIFISYSWEKESNQIADEIENIFKSKNFNIVRDKSNLGYKGLVKEFMDRIGNGKYIILILSENYLKSENCMYELLKIANDDFYNRIFPLILPDTNIFKATDRIKYVHYWENEINNLEKAIKMGSLTNLQGIFSDLNLYAEIRKRIDDITTILKNINTLSIPIHKVNDYTILIEALETKLKTEFTSTSQFEIPENQDYLEIYLKQQFEKSAPDKINQIIKLLRNNESDRKIDINSLNLITKDKSISENVISFYSLYSNFENVKKHLYHSFYLSTTKLNRFYNLNKLSFDERYDNSKTLSNEEKLIQLYEHYRKYNQLIFLKGEMLINKKVPVSSEPVVFFNETFHLIDRISDQIDEIEIDYGENNIMPIGIAHFILEYADPMVYPILQLESEIDDYKFTIQISRKYIPFTSGNTDYLSNLLSSVPVKLSGYGSIEHVEKNHYKIQPIFL